jgi:hypothetical protein
VAVAVVLLAGAAGAAASGWSIEHTPNPTGASSSGLGDVSCASARACTAVGRYFNGTTYVTLAERWNGTKWSIERTPNPTGALESVLEGVSCASAHACTAVGYYLVHGTTGPFGATSVLLVERWNGTKWSIEHTPKPTGASDSFLTSVSCASASACTAVGGYGPAYVTLAERWNGTKWSIEHTPNPTASGSSLGDVSCASAGACTAVGSYPTGLRTNRTLAERWNGTKWSIEHTPNPTGASDSELSGVSCASVRACTAVGDGTYNGGATGVTLAERWNRPR